MLLNANPIALVAFEKSSGSRLPSIIIQDFPGNQNKKKRCIIYKLTYTFPGRDVSELEGGANRNGGAPRKVEEPKRRKHNCADATGFTKTARALLLLLLLRTERDSARGCDLFAFSPIRFRPPPSSPS